MTVSWAATSLTTGRFEPTEHVGTDRLAVRFNELQARGQGYVEVRSGPDFPTLTVGFKGEVAVVHLMSDAETIALLVADPGGSSDAEVLVMDDLVEFAGDFIVTVDRAWSVIDAFAQSGDAAGAGEWCEL